MARYIDADKAIELIKNYGKGAISDGLTTLDAVDDIVYLAKGVDLIPTADVVEAVRCKDCIYKTVTKDGEYNPEDIVCEYHMSDGFDSDDYCSFGKRKVDE